MQKGFAILVVVVVLGSGYWHYIANAECDIPLSYRIGTLDSRFDLSPAEARNAVSAAESLWENATGQNLFSYDEDAAFTINFVYDGRQELTDTEQKFSETLQRQREMSDEVRAEYEALWAEYEELKDQYQARSNTYEEQLRTHNEKVTRWNREGGAPEEVYEELSAEQDALTEEQRELNRIANRLNGLVDEINALGEEGNILVSTYNDVVAAYNERFNTEREFTQGDYQKDGIHIYQYADAAELQIVLAHELGHALSLGHVEGETSIMHHLMGDQSVDAGLSPEDQEEFRRVCGESSAF